MKLSCLVLKHYASTAAFEGDNNRKLLSSCLHPGLSPRHSTGCFFGTTFVIEVKQKERRVISTKNCLCNSIEHPTLHVSVFKVAGVGFSSVCICVKNMHGVRRLKPTICLKCLKIFCSALIIAREHVNTCISKIGRLSAASHVHVHVGRHF